MSRALFAGLLVILFVGSADARVAGAAHPHKYLHNCVEGAVKATCACRGSSGYQVCQPGQWCHALLGACWK